MSDLGAKAPSSRVQDGTWLPRRGGHVALQLAAACLMVLATHGFLATGARQYSDVPLAFFILATVVLFAVKDLEFHRGPGLAALAGVTASCALWTKNEGILFLLAIALMRCATHWRSRSWRDYFRELGWFGLGLLPVLAVAVLFKNGVPVNDVVNSAALGQMGDRYDRAHLARLVVKPEIRGQGAGRRLLEMMIDVVREATDYSKVALFVYKDNEPAYQCYQALGFTVQEYPEKAPLKDKCYYLARDIR